MTGKGCITTRPLPLPPITPSPFIPPGFMAVFPFRTQGMRWHRSWPVLAIALLLSLALVLRFANLERRVHWIDEGIHTLQSFGHYKDELQTVVKEAKRPQPLSSLDHFLKPNPNRSALAPIQILAETEPQSTPIHYVLNRWWSELFGPSVHAQRFLAALLSIGLLPATYWLSHELRSLYPTISPQFPWLATLLVTLSPLQMLYSREIRLYSLWVALSTAVTAALLWAAQSRSPSQSRRRWGTHTLLLIAAAYTFPLEWVSALGRTAWLLITRRSQWRGLALSHGVALLAFAPWAIMIRQNIGHMSKWREEKLALLSLMRSWIEGHSIFVMDWFLIFNDPQKVKLLSFATGGVLAIASGVLLLWLWSRYRAISLLLISVGILPWFVWVVQDLIEGGIRSRLTITLRYYLPSYALFSIVFALGLIQFISTNRLFLQRLAALLLAVWISCGVVCTVQIARSPRGRFAFDHNEWTHIIPKMLKQENALLIIPTGSHTSPFRLLTAHQYLPPDTDFMSLGNPDRVPTLLAAYDKLYVLAPTQRWRERIEGKDNWTMTPLGYNVFILEREET